MANIYKENGYENREDYLSSLADEMGIPLSTVMTVSCLLGGNEDFDALPCELECMLEAF